MIGNLLQMRASNTERRLNTARRNGRAQRGWGLTLAATAALALAGGPAEAAATLNFCCTNPASGTSWRVVVDVDHALVDSAPAQIGGKSIIWSDPERRHFDLNRATGELEMRNASSTGGYFLYFRCRAE